MNICITGDTNFFGEVFEQSSSKEMIKVDSFYNADFRVVNLEQAISENDYLEDKYTIFSDKRCIPYIKDAKIDIASLANNHIHDKGKDGIIETLEILKENNIVTCGAGKNIIEAQQATAIGDNICILSFCDYGKHYLRNVCCATEESPGVNPYSLENVLEALDKLPEQMNAIVYIHWCVEYCWLVPYDYIPEVKKILAHPKTAIVLGTHPHIPLGWMEENGKHAFFSLGNFVFPNFSIRPSHQIFEASKEDRKNFKSMRILCSVKKNTHKKWYFINRVSILVFFDSASRKVQWEYTIQDDEQPIVRKLTSTRKRIVHIFLGMISQIYKLPRVLYIPMYSLNLYGLYAVRKIKRIWLNLLAI